MSESKPVYVLLRGECCSGDDLAILNVVMRFEIGKQHTVQQEAMYDDVGYDFNSALPQGWKLDDAPDFVKLVTPEEAKKKGYVVYMPTPDV